LPTKLKTSALNAALQYADGWLGYQQKLHRLTGLAVAIISQNKVVFNRTYGNAHGDIALDTGHLFPIASNTKMLTAVALLQLQAHNKLSLGDPAAMYLPWLARHADSRWRSVTIHQLLSHRAGIVRDGKHSANWDLQTPAPDAESLRNEIMQAKLVFKPGHRFKYSNYGFAILGDVIAAASGLTYDTYIRKNLLLPLKLKRTCFESEAVNSKRATGYGLDIPQRQRQVFPFVAWAGLTPAAGLWSTPAELAMIAAEIGWGTTWLNPTSRKLLHKPVGPIGKDSQESYGLGLWHYGRKKNVLIGHGGGAIGFTSLSQADPKSKLAIAVYANTIDAPVQSICAGVLSIIDFFRKRDAPKTNTANIRGRFVNLWDVADVVPTGDGFYLAFPSQEKPFADNCHLVESGKQKFVLASDVGVLSIGEPVQLIKRGNRLDQLIIAGNCWQKLAL
jgi:CubicO group peptidase (beta-lactamase class C family)